MYWLQRVQHEGRRRLQKLRAVREWYRTLVKLGYKTDFWVAGGLLALLVIVSVCIFAVGVWTVGGFLLVLAGIMGSIFWYTLDAEVIRSKSRAILEDYRFEREARILENVKRYRAWKKEG